MVGYLDDHSPERLYRVFYDKWIHWAGPPGRATVDMEGGFRGKEFWESVGKQCTTLMSIAGTAHWQAGKIERHNQIIKDIIRNVANQTQAAGREQIEQVADEAIWAKNSLTREHGWSPVSLVFGREPRISGELVEDGNPCAYHPDVGTKDSLMAHTMRYRYRAKMEFVKSQAKHMLQKTVHQRVRKLVTPKIGQLVFFYRDTQKKKATGTHGWVRGILWESRTEMCG